MNAKSPSDLTLEALLSSGEVDCKQFYHAVLALQRLHDRGVARQLTVRDMCEVLGYLVPRRPGRG